MRFYFLSFYVCITISTYAQAPALAIPTDVQHLHINIFNNHSMSNDQASQMQTNASSLAQAHQTNSFLLYFQQQLSPESFNTLKQEAHNAQIQFLTYAQENKANIALCLLGSCYSYIWYQLLYYAYQTLKTDTWSCWEGNLTNEMLKFIPEHELGKKLVVAAQEKYQTSATISDLLTPLVYFLRDIEQEIKNLESFTSLHAWLNTLKLSWFFPSQKSLLSLAQEKCERLHFIKVIFIRWVTDYKLSLNREA